MRIMKLATTCHNRREKMLSALADLHYHALADLHYQKLPDEVDPIFRPAEK